MNTVVFDFDKTLTYKDSLKELFIHEMVGWKYLFRIVYFMLNVFSKFRIITVRQEKEIMIRLLFDSDVALFENKCNAQAKVLDLNPLFPLVDKYVRQGDRVIILSASSIFLLQEVFKEINVEIIGTSFICDKGKIKKIDQHPFSREKYDLLVSNGIDEVDEMYYDSKHDECLIPLCKKWNKVKDGAIVATEFWQN